ncbi:hypothetical protein N7517_009489 [Penicillium concentricum]|uniref:Uncharacterized protein n=1 Tax=Penicillium concentricum TaxID=293559 RepID=A0A9W9RMI2_9EURO|nr:uncharacterized protein N7517_009489 [Penicillium concentricum]KAJ5360298.1 hypothetical protein N7517_009489 [Penicillium concentricum]
MALSFEFGSNFAKRNDPRSSLDQLMDTLQLFKKVHPAVDTNESLEAKRAYGPTFGAFTAIVVDCGDKIPYQDLEDASKHHQLLTANVPQGVTFKSIRLYGFHYFENRSCLAANDKQGVSGTLGASTLCDRK